jgi:hypothetical protein
MQSAGDKGVQEPVARLSPILQAANVFKVPACMCVIIAV